MTQKLENLFTPGGRLVMGSLTEKNKTDHQNQPIPEDKQGYFFGVAIPKDAPGVNDLIAQLYGMAVAQYGQVPLVMQEIQQGLAAAKFSWKIADGDVPRYDGQGQPKPIPAHIQGCFVFKFSTQFDISACDVNGVDLNRADIKRGDYVDVMFNAATNDKMDHTAGNYMNPMAVRRLGFGEAISGSVSASAAFAGHGASMPAGATTMPTSAGATPPAGAGMPQHQQQQQTGMPANPPQTGAPGGMPTGPAGMPGMGTTQPPAGQETASPSNATPHTGILQGPAGGGMPGVS